MKSCRPRADASLNDACRAVCGKQCLPGTILEAPGVLACRYWKEAPHCEYEARHGLWHRFHGLEGLFLLNS